MSEWGGKREGAGRKPERIKKRPVKITVRVSEFTHKVILNEGSGNLSNGIEQMAIDVSVNKGYK